MRHVDTVQSMIEAKCYFEDIEDWIDNLSDGTDDDEKAALWLYALTGENPERQRQIIGDAAQVTQKA
jgi:hypothetical protein